MNGTDQSAIAAAIAPPTRPTSSVVSCPTAADGGPVEIGAGELGALGIGAAGTGAVELGTAEISTVDMGTVGMGTVEIGTAEVGAAQVVRTPRRQRPWILVVVEGSPEDHVSLVWALREAARREATVVALCVLDDSADGPLLDGLTMPGCAERELRTAALDDAVLRAVVETGIQGRTRTAVLDPHIAAALLGAARGADLVMVGSRGKALLRRPKAPTRGRHTLHRA